MTELLIDKIDSEIGTILMVVDGESLCALDFADYFYKHTAQLQLNRDYAKTINSDIISAKTYSGKNPLIYVLLKHNDEYYWPVYDQELQQLRTPKPVILLDLIVSTENTKTALVDPKEIEDLSDACIRAWCVLHGVSEQEVIRECALYLKPEG